MDLAVNTLVFSGDVHLRITSHCIGAVHCCHLFNLVQCKNTTLFIIRTAQRSEQQVIYENSALHPPESLYRVPSSAGVKAGKSSLPIDVTLCAPIWYVISRRGGVYTNCCIRFTLFHFTPIQVWESTITHAFANRYEIYIQLYSSSYNDSKKKQKK